MSLIAFVLIGVLAGFVSRAIVPGARSIGILAMVLGVPGAMLGGVFSLLIDQA